VPRYVLYLTSTFVFGLALGGAADEPAKSAAGRDFVALYDGKGLEGWEATGGRLEAWKADGELLSCVAEGGGWLRTSRKYGDFVLKVDFRIPAGGNSGIGLRLPAEGNPSHDGMEVQILDDEAPEHKDLVEAQYTGSIYYQAPAKRGAARPAGEWNSYEITCRGPMLKVVLNGQTVVDVQLDKFDKGEGEFRPLADRAEVGNIGLQCHGTRVDFRNLQVKDLATTTKSGLRYVDLVEGTGAAVPSGASVAVHYTGRLDDGKKFDSSRDRGKPLSLSLKEVIKGWSEGVPGMKVGGRRKLIIPPELGYGERGAGGVIPPNATLVFDVEVIDLD
jgi:hypothetical protein